MAAVSPAGPEPTMTILEWLGLSCGCTPLPSAGCGRAAAVELPPSAEPSSMIWSEGKSGDCGLSIGLHRSTAGYSGGVCKFRLLSARDERARLAQRADVGQDVAPHELELRGIPDVADAQDGVLRT